MSHLRVGDSEFEAEAHPSSVLRACDGSAKSAEFDINMQARTRLPHPADSSCRRRRRSCGTMPLARDAAATARTATPRRTPLRSSEGCGRRLRKHAPRRRPALIVANKELNLASTRVVADVVGRHHRHFAPTREREFRSSKSLRDNHLRSPRPPTRECRARCSGNMRPPCSWSRKIIASFGKPSDFAARTAAAASRAPTAAASPEAFSVRIFAPVEQQQKSVTH